MPLWKSGCILNTKIHLTSEVLRHWFLSQLSKIIQVPKMQKAAWPFHIGSVSSTEQLKHSRAAGLSPRAGKVSMILMPSSLVFLLWQPKETPFYSLPHLTQEWWHLHIQLKDIVMAPPAARDITCNTENRNKPTRRTETSWALPPPILVGNHYVPILKLWGWGWGWG